MDEIQIPPEGVEAAAKEIYDRGEFITMDDCRLVARAAIRAALRAWVECGMAHRGFYETPYTGYSEQKKIPTLILRTEAST